MHKPVGTRTGTSTPIRRGGPEQPRASSDKARPAGEQRQVAASKGEAQTRRPPTEPSGNRK